MCLSRQQSRHKILRINFLDWDLESSESPTEADDGGGCDPAAQARTPGITVTPLLFSPLHNVDVSPQLCFDVPSDPQLRSILSSQNRHLSIYVHQGIWRRRGSSPAAPLSAVPSSALTLHSGTSIQRRGYDGQRASPLKVVSHVIIIIYKTHSGSLALPAFPSLWPCTLQSIFARNPELLRVSMVARASITWNIQSVQRLPWGPEQGFYSDLIIRHDFFMSYDSPVELESALNPCDSHGNWEGGGGRGGSASVLLFLPCIFNSV